MAIEYAIRDFEDILMAIIERAKIASSLTTVEASTLVSIKRFVNDRYHAISFSKKWPWREDTRVITTTAKLTTGSAAVTQGLKEVTLSVGNTVDVSFEGRYFRVATDPEYYEIISVHDAANRKFLLSAPYKGTTNATAPYTVFRNKYGLFPDYADIIEITPFGMSTVFSPKPINPVSSEEMSKLQASSPFLETQYPLAYTIQDNLNYDGPAMGDNFVMGYDFMGEGPETQALSFYPNLFNSTAVQIKYGLQITPLVDDTDLPLIPFEKRRILVYGGLADWFSLQNKTDLSNFYEGKYTIMLSNMKADFDKAEVRVQLTPLGQNRKRTPMFTRHYPDTE